MRNILFIAYYFPPLSGSGVQKSLKFAKYLPEFGYRPIVLTVNPFYVRSKRDYQQLKELPEDTLIFRTPTFDWSWIFKLLWGLKLNKVVSWLQRNVLLPDPEISWLPFAKRKIKTILKRYPVKLTYISAGPFSSLLLGSWLKNMYHLDFVADFRDEWTNNPLHLDNQYPARSLQKEWIWERQVLLACSALVFTIPHYMRANFIAQYPFVADKPYREITNGFDEADFANLPAVNAISHKKFTIVYAGTFYDRRQPEPLWQAISDLFAQSVIPEDEIEFDIIGKNTPSFVLGKYKADPQICHAVNFKPAVSHKEVLLAQLQADMLLLYIAPGPNSEAELPGKLFDYLRSYKPILAIIPENGITASILRQSKSAYIASSSDVSAISDLLHSVFNLWKQGKLEINPDKEYIKQFNRKDLTAQLATLFDEVFEQMSKKGNP